MIENTESTDPQHDPDFVCYCGRGHRAWRECAQEQRNLFGRAACMRPDGPGLCDCGRQHGFYIEEAPRSWAARAFDRVGTAVVIGALFYFYGHLLWWAWRGFPVAGR